MLGWWSKLYPFFASRNELAEKIRHYDFARRAQSFAGDRAQLRRHGVTAD